MAFRQQQDGDQQVEESAFVPRAEVMAAFATAPVLDESRFRSDLDAAIDQGLPDREW